MHLKSAIIHKINLTVIQVLFELNDKKIINLVFSPFTNQKDFYALNAFTYG